MLSSSPWPSYLYFVTWVLPPGAGRSMFRGCRRFAFDRRRLAIRGRHRFHVMGRVVCPFRFVFVGVDHARACLRTPSYSYFVVWPLPSVLLSGVAGLVYV